MSDKQNAAKLRPVRVECGQPGLTEACRQNNEAGGKPLLPGRNQRRQRGLLERVRNCCRQWRFFSYFRGTPVRSNTASFIFANPRFISKNRRLSGEDAFEACNDL